MVSITTRLVTRTSPPEAEGNRTKRVIGAAPASGTGYRSHDGDSARALRAA